MTPTSTDATTRRQLLRTGALGAAAAAFLASCSTQDEPPAGQSGVADVENVVPPTVPPLEPTQADLDEEITNWRTATSLELLMVATYDEYGPKLSSAEWQAAAERFSADHAAAAEEFADATPQAARIDEPNQVVQEEFIDPVADLLTNDQAILRLFAELESTMAATYLATVAGFTTAEWRQEMAAHASAAARRVAVMGNGGEGRAPTGPLYPATDLLTNAAFLPVNPVAE